MAIHRASRAISCLLFGHVYTCIFSSQPPVGKLPDSGAKAKTIHRQFPFLSTRFFSTKSLREGWTSSSSATWGKEAGNALVYRFYPPPPPPFPFRFTRTYRRTTHRTGSRHFLIRGGVVYSIALGKERMIPSTTELGCSKLLEYNTIRTYVRTYEAVIECRVCRRMA